MPNKTENEPFPPVTYEMWRALAEKGGKPVERFARTDEAGITIQHTTRTAYTPAKQESPTPFLEAVDHHVCSGTNGTVGNAVSLQINDRRIC